MLSREEMQRLGKAFKVNMVIWSAVFISLPIYLVIGRFLKIQQLISEDPNLPTDVLMIALLLISIVELWVTFIIRKKILGSRNIRATVTMAGGAAAWEQQAVARYTVAMVLSAALSESIGIYGLVLFLLSLNEGFLYQFVLLSAAAMLYFRPKKQELVDFAKQIKKQSQ